MKTPFVKAVAGIVLTCLISNVSLAGDLNPTDTGKKKLIAAAEKNNTIILKEANVIFPEILRGHEEESMDYIEKFSASRRDYLVRTYNRGKKYFPKAAIVLKKYNVPTEYKVLMALESGFNANARSSAGALGYWQFMDVVAKEYGLRISQTVKVSRKKNGKTITSKKRIADDRKNFAKSTNAAARYLYDRSRNLDNDWLLIAASYNCGVGNVWDAIKRSGKSNASFWDIKKYLPKETRAYVMNFIALNVIFNNYENFTKNNLCFRDITVQSDRQGQSETGPIDETTIID